MLKAKRDREFGSVSSQEQEKFLSERQNLHDYLEREARRALQGECMAQRKLSEAEMERDGMIWDNRNSDWAAMYGINSQLEPQPSELHRANQWACQAQIHFDQSLHFLSLTKIATHRLAWNLSTSCFRFEIFLGIEPENVAAAAIQVVGCQEVRKDLQLTLGVFLGWLREHLDVHSCQFELFHPYFFFFPSNT